MNKVFSINLMPPNMMNLLQQRKISTTTSNIINNNNNNHNNNNNNSSSYDDCNKGDDIKNNNINNLITSNNMNTSQIVTTTTPTNDNINNYSFNESTKSTAATSSSCLSPISRFYSQKTILITGATGFIGKVLIEKLFYSCPDIKKIYVLIRPAKGKSSRERMIEMTSRKPFNIRLKQEFILQKLVSLDSDLVEPKLGLTQASIDMLANEVDVIFHVAASVKFDAPLEVNMLNNVKATKELLEIAVTFKQLKCFIHVSTAYSNCQLNEIGELIYPMQIPSDGEDPMNFKITDQMIDDRPNTYTYTKAMAENIASKYAKKINIVIVRPSIVMSSMREPAEGWIDTINGPVGLSVLGALGILQKIKVNSEVVFDLIPVDIVTNALVSIGWAATERKSEFVPGAKLEDDNIQQEQEVEEEKADEKSTTTTTNKASINQKENNQLVDTTTNTGSGSSSLDGTIRVFNLTSGDENPCSFYHYFSAGIEEVFRKPSTRALRPLLKIPKQKGIFGHKKIVIKAVNRMHYANEVFDYFTSHQWSFVTDNVKKLIHLQSKEDREIFNCDVKTINWSQYSQIGWIGCRRFILKESDSTIDYARQRYKFVCLVYYLVKLFLILAATTIITSLLSNYSTLVSTTILLPIYGIVYLL